MKYLSGLKINSRYARTFENNCAVISRTADEMNMGTCAYHLADGMTCPAHGVVKQTRPNIHRADPPKPDRNKLCPCGSVLKWKRCCGDPVRIAAEHERRSRNPAGRTRTTGARGTEGVGGAEGQR